MRRVRHTKKKAPPAVRRKVSTVGLVAHYKLYAGFTTPVVAGVSDGSVFDYSLNGNTGVIDKDNAVTLPAYPGFSFDGADSAITVAADSTIDVNGKTVLSISAWINPASDGENDVARIVDKIDNIASPTVGYRFFVNQEAGGLVGLLFALATDTTDVQAEVAPVVPINTWSNVAVVYNEDGAQKGKIYLNGVLQALEVDTAGDDTVSDDSAVDLTIGNATEDTTRTFDGKIDDLRIYNVAKSAAQIKSGYELTRWRYGV